MGSAGWDIGMAHRLAGRTIALLRAACLHLWQRLHGCIVTYFRHNYSPELGIMAGLAVFKQILRRLSEDSSYLYPGDSVLLDVVRMLMRLA